MLIHAKKICGILIEQRTTAHADFAIKAYDLKVADYLLKHPFLFLAYWGTCAFLTGLALINAMLDMIIMRRRTRDEQISLAEKSFADVIEAEKKKRGL